MLTTEEIKTLAELSVVENTDETDVAAHAPQFDQYNIGDSATVDVAVNGGNWNYFVTINPDTEMVMRIRRNDDRVIFTY